MSDCASREDWDRALSDKVASYEPDLVVSAGFMKLAGPAFLERFGGRYVNTHPALLPSFPGMHGARDALEYGVKVTGATLFVVDARRRQRSDRRPDRGRRRRRRHVETLHERIKAAERVMLVDVVGRMVRDGYSINGRKVTLS